MGAHWAQTYASLLQRAASHKDVEASGSPLLRLYYGSRAFMGLLCVGQEAFYLALYAASFPALGPGWLPTRVALPRLALAPGAAPLFDAAPLGAMQLLAALCAPLWALKQATNVLQGRFAAKRLLDASAP